LFIIIYSHIWKSNSLLDLSYTIVSPIIYNSSFPWGGTMLDGIHVDLLSIQTVTWVMQEITCVTIWSEEFLEITSDIMSNIVWTSLMSMTKLSKTQTNKESNIFSLQENGKLIFSEIWMILVSKIQIIWPELLNIFQK